MKEQILATMPSPIATSQENFSVSYPKYGSGTVSLTAFGDYELTVQGITEAAARRTNEYKAAYNKVSMNMLHAYEAENRRYTSIHLDMPEVLDISTYEQELVKLMPEVYKRTRFALPEPTKSEVEEDLRREVHSLNFDITKQDVVSETEYIRQHLNTLTEARRQAWQEACELFNKIEDAREETENAKFRAEYKRIYNEKQEYIEGKEPAVKAEISEMCRKIEIPYNATLTYYYKQNQHLLDVEIVFDDGIHVPATKAAILSSGKVSIKNKLVKEVISDKTNSALSVAYYLASHLLNVSPNIYFLRMSVYDRNKQNPLLWVEFTRYAFSRIIPRMVNLHSDILSYPCLVDFKSKGDVLELATMNADVFKKNVQSEIDRIDQSRISDL